MWETPKTKLKILGRARGGQGKNIMQRRISHKWNWRFLLAIATRPGCGGGALGIGSKL